MRRERRFGLPAFGLILTCGLVFLSLGHLASGAQKRMLLMGGVRGVVHNAAGEPL